MPSKYAMSMTSNMRYDENKSKTRHQTCVMMKTHDVTASKWCHSEEEGPSSRIALLRI